MSVYTAVTPLDRLSLATAYPIGVERREGERTDFSYHFRVVLSGGEKNEQGGNEAIVTGKDLTERGIGFRHEFPLPYRRVRLVAADERLTQMGLADLEFEVILRWCRFLGPGRCESGGRIVRPSIGAA